MTGGDERSDPVSCISSTSVDRGGCGPGHDGLIGFSRFILFGDITLITLIFFCRRLDILVFIISL